MSLVLCGVWAVGLAAVEATAADIAAVKFYWWALVALRGEPFWETLDCDFVMGIFLVAWLVCPCFAAAAAFFDVFC